MRRTRFMSVLFLILSASFFAMPQFRQAFTLPIAMTAYDWNSPAPPLMTAIPARVTRQWLQDAEAKHDARMLAFLAIHADGIAEATRLAAMASSYDPQYTWTYYEIFNLHRTNAPDQALEWIRKVQRFEPANALGYLAEAEFLRERNPVLKAVTNPTKPDYAERLQQKDWAEAMEKAFNAPKFDNYNIRRFDLERKVLHATGYDTPVRMMFYVAGYPISNLLNIRQYANLRILYQAAEAEKAGKTKEALDHYYTVAHFGERMQLGSTSLIEQLIATAVRYIAYRPLAALLRKTGDLEAATTIEQALALLDRQNDQFRGKDVLALNSSFVWNALVVNVFLGLVAVFSVLTVASILYVNLKRWRRAQKKGATYQGITIAENYFPVLLFIFCAALYIAYYPYARNFSYYMTAQGDMHNLESLFYSTISLPLVLPRFMTLSVGNPFVPYVYWAGGGIVAALIVFLLFGRTQPQTESAPQAQAAAAGK